jgi:outer membrane protein TolC
MFSTLIRLTGACLLVWASAAVSQVSGDTAPAVTPEEARALSPQEAPIQPTDPFLAQEVPNQVPLSTAPADSVAVGVSLEEVMEMAIAQSPELRVLKAEVNESQMRALATGLLPNPAVSGGWKKVSGGDTGPLLEVAQEIPINGVLGLQRSAAWLSYRADQTESLRKTQVFLHKVQQGYVRWVTARALSDLENAHERISERSLNLVNNRFETGLVAELPLSLAKAEHAARVQSARLAEREVGVAAERLAGLLGVPGETLEQPSGDPRETLLDANLNPEDFVRPDLEASRLRVQSVDRQVQAANRARLPNPVLGYSREEAGDETENFFSVGIEVPILNSGKRAVQQQWASRQTAQSRSEVQSIQVETERDVALNVLNERREAAATYEENILPAVRQSLEAANAAFEGGTTDLSVLLQTQARLLEMERESIRALEDLRLAELDYLLALGLPKSQS